MHLIWDKTYNQGASLNEICEALKNSLRTNYRQPKSLRILEQAELENGLQRKKKVAYWNDAYPILLDSHCEIWFAKSNHIFQCLRQILVIHIAMNHTNYAWDKIRPLRFNWKK